MFVVWNIISLTGLVDKVKLPQVPFNAVISHRPRMPIPPKHFYHSLSLAFFCLFVKLHVILLLPLHFQNSAVKCPQLQYISFIMCSSTEQTVTASATQYLPTAVEPQNACIAFFELKPHGGSPVAKNGRNQTCILLKRVGEDSAPLCYCSLNRPVYPHQCWEMKTGLNPANGYVVVLVCCRLDLMRKKKKKTTNYSFTVPVFSPVFLSVFYPVSLLIHVIYFSQVTASIYINVSGIVLVHLPQ